MNRLTAALAVALAGTGVASAQTNEVEPYVQAFCSLREADGGAQRIHLLSASLGEAVRAALEENARLQAQTPDEKPPLGDGVPYQSVVDLAPECAPGAVTAEGDAMVAEVNYSFPDQPDANWTDRLVLTRDEGGVFYIDDIRYGAEGDETLRGTLEGAFSD